ncbi:response regulator [Paenibacillus sp. LMG 31456]|uniref:Response regulator n=1 Tax=Paenibacillus foliorum TaxID=2654974 RepID=A0A972K4W2_9BACL|nr:helix-turn-helix domain-containing protein [Paenibacillus foliorum]NOU97373.1 response regulator [Paenibacillus foliorum]
MWKVLLVDDSYPVLEFLLHIIPWESLEMEVIGMHYNGKEALEHCKLEMPHILITDIGMPEIDGLELTKAAKQLAPLLKVIILSCHDDFQYAQQAVKLNVMDYILKEKMKPETIIEILKTTQLQLDQENKVLESQVRLKSILDQNNSLLKESFIRSTLMNPIHDTKRWETEAQQFGIHMDKHIYVPVLCFAKRLCELKQRYQSDELFKYVFENGINELVDTRRVGVSFHYAVNQIILLLPLRPNHIIKDYNEIRYKLTAIQVEFEEKIRISLSFILSVPSHTPSEIKQRLKEITDSKNQRFYENSKSMYKWEPFQYSTDDIYKYFSLASDELKQLIVEGRIETVEGVLNRWEQMIRTHRFKVEEVHGWVLKLMSDIDLKYRSLRHFQKAFSTERFHNTVLELESLEELFDYMRHFLMEKIDYVTKSQHESERREVIEAKRYVMTHMSEKIVMEEIARMLFLNASHFSRIFKMETGETFIEFVTRYKMERAQEYLLQSEKSIERIAEMLGYENTSYFIKLFKAFSGMSPVNFRKLK